jgi:cysteine-rich repeat protein
MTRALHALSAACLAVAASGCGTQQPETREPEQPQVRRQEITAACGNASVEAGEQCDDGNLLTGDGCSTTCTREVFRVAAGANHSLVLREDGAVWSWGSNGSGQLGDNTTVDRVASAAVQGLGQMKEVKAYASHSLALRASDGTVWAWGRNTYGQLGESTTTTPSRPLPVQVSSLSGIKALAVSNHVLALDSDGAVHSWGYNSNGQLGDGTTTDRFTPHKLTSLSNVVAIAAGASHSLAASASPVDGTVSVHAWGLNSSGQLGDGTTLQRSTPVLVAGLSKVVALAAGTSHSLALSSGGTVYAWGLNTSGQLGDGTTTTRRTPIPVPGLTNVVAISAGANYSLALRSDGTVYAWGLNTSGQLGDGTTTTRRTPIPVPNLTNVVAIAAGDNHSLAVRAVGTVYAWGDNDNGQLGDGSTTNRATPTQALLPFFCGNGVVEPGEACDDGNSTHGDGCSPLCTTEAAAPLCGNASVEAGEQCDDGNVASADGCSTTCTREVFRVATGANHSLMLREDGAVWSWGSNGSGQLGDGSTTLRNSPVPTQGLGQMKEVKAYASHSLALRASDGTVWAWGRNTYGQLGESSSTTSSRPLPVQVSSLSGIKALAVSNHVLALDSDGAVHSWGYNSNGQLGDGTTTNRFTPHKLPSPLLNVRTLAAGASHSLALRSNGTVYAWGLNSSGQLGDGSNATRFTPVLVAGLSKVVALAAGTSHSLALSSEGTVYAWGLNTSGQLGDGTTTNRKTPILVPDLTNVVAISAGANYSLALRSDGTVYAWGLNTSGQLGDGTTTTRRTPIPVPGLTNVVAIAAGDNHSLAVRVVGTVYAWGDNDNGQLGDGSTTNRATPAPVQLFSTCGNGIVEATEQCDDANTDDTDACRQDCRLARCGDGVVQAGVETCDDGNTVDGDGCPAYCRELTPSYSTTEDFARKLCGTLKRGQINLTRARGHAVARPSVEDAFQSVYSSTRLGLLDSQCAPGDALFDALLASLQGATTALDPATFNRCLAKVEQARATSTRLAYNQGSGNLATLRNDADCRALFVGKRTSNQPCARHWDCASSYVCQADAATQTTLRCEALAPAGSSCGPARQCAASAECVAGTCRALADSGARCGNGQPSCKSDFYCSTADGTCKPAKLARTACTYDSECATGLSCSAGTCTALRAPISDGLACVEGTDSCHSRAFVCRPEASGGAARCLARGGEGAGCSTEDHCRQGLVCEAGTCARPPALGKPCTGVCQEGLHCGAAGVCAQHLPLGATCQPGDSCQDGYCGAGGLCRAFSDLGEACGTAAIPSVCQRGACINQVCIGGSVGDSCRERRYACVAELGLVCGADYTCVTAPPAGSPALDGRCAPGAFVNASGLCEAPRAVGAACSASPQCASGVCLRSNVCGVKPAPGFTRREEALQSLQLGFAP